MLHVGDEVTIFEDGAVFSRRGTAKVEKTQLKPKNDLQLRRAHLLIQQSSLSTAGPMHIAMELRWLPCANWLREGRCEQMTYP